MESLVFFQVEFRFKTTPTWITAERCHVLVPQHVSLQTSFGAERLATNFAYWCVLVIFNCHLIRSFNVKLRRRRVLFSNWNFIITIAARLHCRWVWFTGLIITPLWLNRDGWLQICILQHHIRQKWEGLIRFLPFKIFRKGRSTGRSFTVGHHSGNLHLYLHFWELWTHWTLQNSILLSICLTWSTKLVSHTQCYSQSILLW